MGSECSPCSPAHIDSPLKERGEEAITLGACDQVYSIEEVSNTNSEDSSTTYCKRDDYVFDITFQKRPLGIILTSAFDGSCAYVTDINRQNEAVKNHKLPLYSKLLKVNGNDVELWNIVTITDVIVELAEDPPLTLTFCHPEGLRYDEIPDPEHPETERK